MKFELIDSVLFFAFDAQAAQRFAAALAQALSPITRTTL
jgi:hypothetical protein